jgi:hypothetical protein
MSAWTLQEAQNHLNIWLAAEVAVATGQSYQINGRRLDRANLYQIREQIKFWSCEVEKIKSGGKRRVFRITPRDQ